MGQRHNIIMKYPAHRTHAFIDWPHFLFTDISVKCKSVRLCASVLNVIERVLFEQDCTNCTYLSWICSVPIFHFAFDVDENSVDQTNNNNKNKQKNNDEIDKFCLYCAKLSTCVWQHHVYACLCMVCNNVVGLPSS